MTVGPLPLPASYALGFVMCNVVQITADSTDDADRLPEARPAKGKVIFHPIFPSRKVVTDKAFALHQDAVFDVNDQGQLVDAQGLPGAWIVTGSYDVEFKVAGGTVPGFPVTVTTGHTFNAPLWLPQAAPFVPVPGAPVTTLVVPSGQADGQVLAWVGGGLGWVTPSTGGGTGGAPSNEVRWDGVAWPPRPTGAPFGVRFLSTNDPAAPPPPTAGLLVGDTWIRLV